MPVSLIDPNTRVTAFDWWNPVSQLLNTVEANLATEVTNRTAGVAAINTRLNSTISAGGISDLPTWKTSTDSGVTAINTRLNSTIALTGISDLPAWKTSTDAKVAGLSTTISDVQNAAGTTSSLTFVSALTGGVACGAAFVAPASGRVLVTSTSQLGPGGGGLAMSSLRVRTGGTIGSGTDHVAVSDDNLLFCGNDARSSLVLLVTGLTAGNTYNVQQMFRTTVGTATFQRKTLYVTGSL